jgi:hypothetical protein
MGVLTCEHIGGDGAQAPLVVTGGRRRLRLAVGRGSRPGPSSASMQQLPRALGCRGRRPQVTGGGKAQPEERPSRGRRGGRSNRARGGREEVGRHRAADGRGWASPASGGAG